MASTNKNLHNAKKEKDDEYYTILSDIESELSHYSSCLKDKTILCNCNDSPQSAFYQYFMRNFEKLQLKKLITIYPSRKFTYDGTTIMDTHLDNDGDFRKNKDTLQEADIIITNPPFSLFREYITQLFKYSKNFLIIGNKNAVKYKEIFPYIKNNLFWLGYTSPIKFNTQEGKLLIFIAATAASEAVQLNSSPLCVATITALSAFEPFSLNNSSAAIM